MSASVRQEGPHSAQARVRCEPEAMRYKTRHRGGTESSGEGIGAQRRHRKPLACSLSHLFVQEGHVTCTCQSRVHSDRKAAETASPALKGSTSRKVSETKSHIEKPPGGRSLGEPLGGKQTLLRLDAVKTPVYPLTSR